MSVLSKTKPVPDFDRLPDKELFRPLARTAFYAARSIAPRIRATVRATKALDDQAPIFLIGCGRSGTTLLGELFAAHPEVSYRYEPYALWAAVDPTTDVLQLYSRGEHHCMLGASSVTATAQLRFKRLLSAPSGLTLVEKSPINALRIGYLDSLVPAARFVHIVRDGVDVARSIERVARITKRMVFRQSLNDWWGVGDAKWAALEQDGQNAGYYPEEVQQLTTDAQRGAYEWLLSLREIEDWRTRLGSRFVELRYQDLTDSPRDTLRTVMDSLGLACPDSWLEKAAAQVDPAREWDGKRIELPYQMCADFNKFQEKFQFKNRALNSSGPLDRTTAVTENQHVRYSTPRPPELSSHITVASMTSLTEVRAFTSEWAEFAGTAGAKNPFVHPDWLMPWAQRFVRSNEKILLLAARQHGRLVGVAPFYRRSWGSGLAHSMQLWGTGRHCELIELPQILLDQEHPRNVARALVSELCAEANAWDWAFVPLQDPLWFEPDWLPKGGSIIALTSTVRASVVRPIDELSPPVAKRNVRESMRRARNRLNRAYPERWSISRATGCPDILDALSDLSSLHETRSRMIGKEIHPNVLRQKCDLSFLRAALSASGDRGGACIYRLVVDGCAIAALLVLRTAECSYFLLSGMSEPSWEYSPITLLQGYAIDDAVKLGHRQVNLSTGPNTAKMRWSEQISVHPEFVLIPDRPLSLATFGTYWLASAAASLKRERGRHRLFVQPTPLSGRACTMRSKTP